MRRIDVFAVVASLFFPACNLMAQSGAQNALSGNQIIERVSPSAVLILVGKGDGQVAGVGSGVVLWPEGFILTANHVVKGMREVQIRLKNGEVYDQVELIAADERRDVAALRIPATALPVLPIGNAASVTAGASVFAVSNAAELPWTASPDLRLGVQDDPPQDGHCAREREGARN
jgi:S1-C subfamily serine protease